MRGRPSSELINSELRLSYGGRCCILILSGSRSLLANDHGHLPAGREWEIELLATSEILSSAEDDDIRPFLSNATSSGSSSDKNWWFTCCRCKYRVRPSRNFSTSAVESFAIQKWKYTKQSHKSTVFYRLQLNFKRLNTWASGRLIVGEAGAEFVTVAREMTTTKRAAMWTSLLDRWDILEGRCVDFRLCWI